MSSDYKPFNRKKKYNKHYNALNRQPNSLNKTVQINHYHSNDSSFQDYNQIKQNLEKANELIHKFSLMKPIKHNFDSNDRYTPMPYRCTSSEVPSSPEFVNRNTDVSELLDKIHELTKDNERLINMNKELQISPDISLNMPDDLPNLEPNIMNFVNRPMRNVYIRPLKLSKLATNTNILKQEQLEKQEKQEEQEEQVEQKEQEEQEEDKMRPIIICATPTNLYNRIKFHNNTLSESTVTTPKLKKEPKTDTVETKIEPSIEEIIFTDEIKNITDLINLSKKYPITEYPDDPSKKYSIDIHKLHAIVPYLIELNEMVGMENIKSGLTIQLMYFLQGFEYKHMLHTFIEGPPGVGKTCLGRILGKIYLELKCLNTENIDTSTSDDEDKLPTSLFASMFQMHENKKPKDTTPKLKFKIAKRSDFVGQYVGHTAIKTQKLINECFGGVLFIDEAYSLGADDPFSKECINTLNQNLSENGDKFICIIAGYTETLESNFFSYNSGLSRRFPFRYTIDKYSGNELCEILKGKFQKEKYTLDSTIVSELEKFINTNKEYFPNFGGDIETYFFQIKMMHAKRVFGKSILLRNIFNKDDIVNGLTEMKKNQKQKDVTCQNYYN
jgi:hypothetical protein